MKHFTMLLLLPLYSLVCAQTYPRWFLYQGTLDCNSTAVGYAATGYYKDSSMVAAFRNSTFNHAKNSFCSINGGQGFWNTEVGGIWMGKDITVSFDTTLTAYYEQVLIPKEFYTTNGLQIVLALEENCSLSNFETELIDLNASEEPDWLITLPQSREYYFATGQAAPYYYESSSWLEAEENARINLAKQICIEIQSMKKTTTFEGQAINKEEISVSLSNVKIISRWVKVSNNIFYTLIKMPKN